MGYIKMSSFQTKQSLVGNEMIIGISTKNVKIPLDVLKNYLIGVYETFAFRGNITPSTPNEGLNGIYIPTISGTYTNFGGLVVDLSEGLVVISQDDAGAESILVPIDLAGYATKDDIKDMPKFIPAGNLFDKDAVTPNRYISPTNGELVVTTDISASDWIAIEPNTDYYRNNGSRPMAFYDEDKVFISGAATGSSLHSPSNAYFMKVSVDDSMIDTYMIVKGDSAPPSYLQYGQKQSINLILNEANFSGVDVGMLAGFVSAGNLFNKDTSLSGRYINYLTGEVVSNPNYYASDYIPVVAGEFLRQNQNQQLAFYDENRNYVTGITTPGSQPYQVPPGCYFVRVTLLNPNSFMLVKGTDLPPVYIAYTDVKKPNQWIEASQILPASPRIYTVAASGGDFTLISEALASVSGSIVDPATIIVEDGTYNDTFTTKNYVDIIARNPKKAIIQLNRPSSVDYNDYSTIFGHTTTLLQGLVVKCSNAKYPLHSDFGNANTPYKLRAVNCVFQHDGGDLLSGTAVGIGLYQNQHITLEDCEIVANVTDVTTGGTGVHLHDISNSAGTGYRSLTVNRCKIHRCTNGFQIYSVATAPGQMNDVFVFDTQIDALVADFRLHHEAGVFNFNIKTNGTGVMRVNKINSDIPNIEEPGFTKRLYNNTASVIPAFSVVVQEPGRYGAARMTSVAGANTVVGVALTEIQPGGIGVVQLRGWTRLRVDGTDAISAGDDLQTHTQPGVGSKGTSNAFATAVEGYSGAGSTIQVILK